MGISVNVGGSNIEIKVGEKIEDVKARFNEEIAAIFDVVDTNKNGRIDAEEIETLKAKFSEQNIKVEVSEDGNTPKRAYNDAIQNMKGRYSTENLNSYYKSEDADLHEIVKGDTLYKIAENLLREEGLPVNAKSINDRIAQIANLNNIKDVNNIKIGTKLIVKLSESGVQKVKDADGNSAVAFSNVSTPSAGGGQGEVKGGGSTGGTTGSRTGKIAGKPLTPAKTEGRVSSLGPIMPNGLDMGSGVPVDKDGNELKDANGNKNFADPKFAEGGYIMKYTATDADGNTVVMFQTTFKGHNGNTYTNLKLSAASIDDLNRIKKEYETEALKIKKATGEESAEAKAERLSTNLTALKELVRISNNNIQVIKNVARKLLDDNYVDRTSDEYKAFVQDLLLTRNAEVLETILPTDNNGEMNNAAVANDKEGAEIVSELYQEIRNKENSDKLLSKEEITLKGALNARRGNGFYQIEADSENGVHAKATTFVGSDNIKGFVATSGNLEICATDEKVLDDFLTELEAADSDEKKAALFKKYAGTSDVLLAATLAIHANDLKANDEDIISLVNNNGLSVLGCLNSKIKSLSADVKTAVVERYKTIFAADRGNLNNAAHLKSANDFINNLDIEDNEKDKIRHELIDSYFDITTEKDEDGNEVKKYTFNPSRKPTYQEMQGLSLLSNNCLDSSADEALANYIKQEEMGYSQYSDAMENFGNSYEVRNKYEEFVDEMQTPAEVINFIDNRMSSYKNYNMPFGKILEKFADNADVMNRLVTIVDENSAISYENKVKLAKHCTQIDGNGNVTFDPAKLPKGVSTRKILDTLLPKDCSKGDEQKIYEAIIMSYADVNDEFTCAISNHKSFSQVKKNKVNEILKNSTRKDTNMYTNLAIIAFKWNYLENDEKKKIFDESSVAQKYKIVQDTGYNKDGAVTIIGANDSIDKLVKNYLRQHLYRFPRLQESVKNYPSKWNEERIDKALDVYMNDFRKDIMADLGYVNGKQLNVNDMIDLTKVQWAEHQPMLVNYIPRY